MKEMDKNVEDVYKKIGELFENSISMKNSSQYFDFLDYVGRLKRHYSVYNIALVFAQNPKVSFFGSKSFYRRFGRYVDIDARPYVIVKPFGPTDFVYDINDTHGDNDMDKIIKSFDINSTTGDIEKSLVDKLAHRIYSRGIYLF